jgi:hypothetical protein
MSSQTTIPADIFAVSTLIRVILHSHWSSNRIPKEHLVVDLCNEDAVCIL